ncbi:MAG: arsenite efflux transporter metallochaperone ArsD [Streptosporangiaceae bacterium]
MAKVEVFDPPMCCSTGVCGPSVDPALAAFAADLSWLADQGVEVERHTLSQEPRAFAERDLVRGLLAERGDDALPAVLVDGDLRSSGRYPSRQELSSWTLSAAPSGALGAVTAELVAMGAAIGANCESCFRYHYDEARRLGVGSDTMAAAVRVAQTVKDTPARSMSDLVAKFLGAEETAAQPAVAGPSASSAAVPATGGGCCDGEAADPEAPAAETAPAAASACCGGEASESVLTLVTTAPGSAGCCG